MPGEEARYSQATKEEEAGCAHNGGACTLQFRVLYYEKKLYTTHIHHASRKWWSDIFPAEIFVCNACVTNTPRLSTLSWTHLLDNLWTNSSSVAIVVIPAGGGVLRDRWTCPSPSTPCRATSRCLHPSCIARSAGGAPTAPCTTRAPSTSPGCSLRGSRRPRRWRPSPSSRWSARSEGGLSARNCVVDDKWIFSLYSLFYLNFGS